MEDQMMVKKKGKRSESDDVKIPGDKFSLEKDSELQGQNALIAC